MVSSILGNRPTFPVLQDLRRFSKAQQCNFDAKAQSLFSTMQTGWSTSILIKRHADLVVLAINAARLTAVLDHSQRRCEGSVPMFVICGLTTVYQHDLNQMNPQSADTFVPERNPDDIFHVARLAIQIYTNLVLFPLSLGWASKPRLCKDMRRALTAYHHVSRPILLEDTPNFDDQSTLLLWATVMGTVISEGMRDRYWYMRRLIHLISKMDFAANSWTKFRAILVRYLWWDYVFDQHARDIWDEVWGMDREAENDGEAGISTYVTDKSRVV